MNRRLLGWALHARGAMAALVGLSLLVTLTYALQGLLVAAVVAAVVGGGAISGTLPEIAGFVALQGIRAVALWRREVSAATAAARIKEAVRADVYAQLLRFGPGEVRRRRTGAVQATLVDGVDALDAYVGRFLPRAVASVLGAGAIAGLLIAIDPVIGLVVAAGGVLVPLVPWLSQRVLRSRMDPWMDGYRGLYAENLDAVQGMATLTVFGAARRRGEELDARAAEFCRVSIRLCAVIVLYVGVVGLAIGFGTAIASGLGALRHAEGQLSALGVLLVLLLTRECFRPLHDLQNAFHAGYPALSAAAGIFEVLDAPVPVRSPAEPVVLPRTAAPALRFEDLTFTYPGRETPALRGLSLDVAPGEHVAVVGRSGAGKTTLVNVLLRWFDPQAGRVLIDGVPVTALALEDLRGRVALVSQDTYLFHRSVRDNLTLGGDVPDERLRAALRAANAAAFVDALPHGLDTVVGERGLTLSGGERQRLSIARALVADAPVLVLDEATSSVDAANEREIAAALDRAARGRTTLTIAHRLSTVRGADRIVVLDHGGIVESGTHDELVGRGGSFARLVSAQELSA